VPQFPSVAVPFGNRNLEQWRNNGGHKMRVIYSVQGPRPQRTLAVCSPDSSLAVPVSREMNNSLTGLRAAKHCGESSSSTFLRQVFMALPRTRPPGALQPFSTLPRLKLFQFESSRLRVPLAPTPERWKARRRWEFRGCQSRSGRRRPRAVLIVSAEF
jgi:hypothetical protein